MPDSWHVEAKANRPQGELSEARAERPEPKSLWPVQFVQNLGQVAQLVEQRTENPCVGGSIPPLATNLFNGLICLTRCHARGVVHGWTSRFLVLPICTTFCTF